MQLFCICMSSDGPSLPVAIPVVRGAGSPEAAGPLAETAGALAFEEAAPLAALVATCMEGPSENMAAMKAVNAQLLYCHGSSLVVILLWALCILLWALCMSVSSVHFAVGSVHLAVGSVQCVTMQLSAKHSCGLRNIC